MLFTLYINHSLILYLLLSLSLCFSLPRMIIHTITRSTAELSQSASASLLAKLTIIALSCPSLPLCRTLSLSLCFSLPALLMLFLCSMSHCNFLLTQF